MVSDQMAAQITAIEQQVKQHNNDIDQLASDVSIGCEGKISPIIETKLLGMATAYSRFIIVDGTNSTK